METIEIKDFKLTLEFSQYWISYEENGNELTYPILMTPYNFFKLFEIEGIELTKKTDNQIEEEGISFTKTSLIRHKRNITMGLLLGEEGDNLTPISCWVNLD